MKYVQHCSCTSFMASRAAAPSPSPSTPIYVKQAPSHRSHSDRLLQDFHRLEGRSKRCGLLMYTLLIG